MMIGRLATVALCCCLVAFAQSEKEPSFDAVSLKALGPNVSVGPGPAMILGLRFTPTRVSGNSQIPALIQEAYAVKPFQIVLPDNQDLRLNAYEIVAVMPERTSRETARLMLRSMLGERFGLQFHRETREIPVYVLGAPGKTKLQPIDPEKAKSSRLDTPRGRLLPGIKTSMGPGWYAANYTTIEEFAGQMSFSLDRPLIDQTGLTGSYAIQLRWDANEEPDMIAVIEKQLGFKIEKRKMPYEMLVVDHVELKPSPN